MWHSEDWSRNDPESSGDGGTVFCQIQGRSLRDPGVGEGFSPNAAPLSKVSLVCRSLLGREGQPLSAQHQAIISPNLLSRLIPQGVSGGASPPQASATGCHVVLLAATMEMRVGFQSLTKSLCHILVILVSTSNGNFSPSLFCLIM